MKDMKQGDGIGSAGYPNKHSITGLKHAVFENGFSDEFNYRIFVGYKIKLHEMEPAKKIIINYYKYFSMF